MIYAKKPSELQESGGREAAKSGAEPGAPIKAPKVIYTLMPAYPEELRQQGVQGEVGLQVIIDEKGAVMEVRVTNSLHPYLDFAAVQALRQWKYEPAVQSGKPISVFHDVTILFNPQTYRYFEKKAREEAGTSAGEEPSSGSILAKVLDGTAGYCRKLSGASLDFICEEKIHEIHYNFATEPQWAALAVSSRETGKIIEQTWFPQWDPKRTEKNKYVCDYLFVRKGDNLEERRIVLNDNGRKMPDRNRLLEEKRYTALNPVLATVQILDQDRQPLFNFRLIGTENLHERKAFVIEAIPKSGNTWGVEYAKIWIDQKSFQVLKNEIQGVPLEGYDDVLRDSVHFRVRPYLLTTHTYEFEKTGIRFPSRSTIRVEYPKLGDFYGDRTLKLKIEMSYDKYKFFTVETEEIDKK
jgi:TonB family protein